LRTLDAVLGDGDMSVTAELGYEGLIASLYTAPSNDIGMLLIASGRHLNRACPPTFGMLLASGFIEAGSRVTGRSEIGFGELSLLGEGAIDAIMKTGHSDVGDKTLLDSLVPAVRAFARAIADGADETIAAQVAVDAARRGMEATVLMTARHGRARYRADGGVGTRDAGATAMYYIIESFCQELIGARNTATLREAPVTELTTHTG
jgi:hypothetical protein